jgi:hypothetical protein
MRWRREAGSRRRDRWAGGPAPARAVEFGWKVHAAQEAWTAKVDTKAAIFFTLQTALLAALIAAHARDRLLGQLTGWRHVLADVSIGLSSIAVLVAGAAVVPLLGRSATHRRGHRDHLIYFGHLRHWDPDDLAVRLQKLTAEDEMQQLSRQLVELSRRNWKKHRRLQAAMTLAVAGAACVTLALMWPH